VVVVGDSRGHGDDDRSRVNNPFIVVAVVGSLSRFGVRNGAHDILFSLPSLPRTPNAAAARSYLARHLISSRLPLITVTAVLPRIVPRRQPVSQFSRTLISFLSEANKNTFLYYTLKNFVILPFQTLTVMS
jgi:hypothetical protein